MLLIVWLVFCNLLLRVWCFPSTPSWDSCSTQLLFACDFNILIYFLHFQFCIMLEIYYKSLLLLLLFLFFFFFFFLLLLLLLPVLSLLLLSIFLQFLLLSFSLSHLLAVVLFLLSLIYFYCYYFCYKDYCNHYH